MSKIEVCSRVEGKGEWRRATTCVYYRLHWERQWFYISGTWRNYDPSHHGRWFADHWPHVLERPESSYIRTLYYLFCINYYTLDTRYPIGCECTQAPQHSFINNSIISSCSESGIFWLILKQTYRECAPRLKGSIFLGFASGLDSVLSFFFFAEINS